MGHPEHLDGVVVAKVGSSTLVDGHGAIDHPFIEELCAQLVELKSRGFYPVLVSSGAVAAGMERLGLPTRPTDMAGLQAAAAAGQAALMETYAEVLGRSGVSCGQVLLTRRDVMDRDGYLNIRNTFDRLLELGAIPIVNENDTVSPAEFTFGDNDMLGAIVATLLGAERYVVLSDVDGLYDENPQVNPNAQLISRVERIDAALMATAGDAGSSVGTGGMRSKLRAARSLMAAGIPMTIVFGRRPQGLVDAVAGVSVGTDFSPKESGRKSSRKLWIGLAGAPAGSVTVDDGAMGAIIEEGASLLPVGVTAVEGEFAEGDVVNVKDARGTIIARGTSAYGSDDLRKCQGLHLDVIGRFIPSKAESCVVHRDDLLVF